jgi:hypothetical protein
MNPVDPPVAGEIVAALNWFADLVNRGEMAAAVACFTEAPSIIEDLAPFHWRGPAAGAEWLGAMAANAEREGFSRIEMKFREATLVLAEAGRGYAVLPGDLTFTLAEGGVRHVQGHATFAVQKAAGDWKIEALTWAWLREVAV